MSEHEPNIGERSIEEQIAEMREVTNRQFDALEAKLLGQDPARTEEAGQVIDAEVVDEGEAVKPDEVITKPIGTITHEEKLSAAQKNERRRTQRQAAKAEARTSGVSKDHELGKKFGYAALILAVGAGSWFGRGLFDNENNTPRNNPRVVGAATPEASPSPSKYSQNFASGIRKLMPEIKPDEIAIAEEVDFKKNPDSDRGTGTFGEDTLDSQAEIAEFLASNDKRAVAARKHVTAALKNRPRELKRALSGEGYIPVQFKIPVIIEGNTVYVNGKVLKISNPNAREAGDIIWLFVDKDGHIVDDASLRADCRNPDFDVVKPKRPRPPRSQPTPTPKVPPKKLNTPGDGSIPEVEGPGAGGTPGPEGTQSSNPDPEPRPTASEAPTEDNPGEGETDESGI